MRKIQINLSIYNEKKKYFHLNFGYNFYNWFYIAKCIITMYTGVRRFAGGLDRVEVPWNVVT